MPLARASDHLDVCERELAGNFQPEKLLNQFKGAYLKAPSFSRTFPLLEEILHCDARNLFRFLHHALLRVCSHLNIETEVRVSSQIRIDHGLKGQEKVLALCHAVEATHYVNSIGGTALYSGKAFQARHVELQFLRMTQFQYPQFNHEFVPMLSIIDVLMFNPIESVRSFVASRYEICRAAMPQPAELAP